MSRLIVVFVIAVTAIYYHAFVFTKTVLEFQTKNRKSVRDSHEYGP